MMKKTIPVLLIVVALIAFNTCAFADWDNEAEKWIIDEPGITNEQDYKSGTIPVHGAAYISLKTWAESEFGDYCTGDAYAHGTICCSWDVAQAEYPGDEYDTGWVSFPCCAKDKSYTLLACVYCNNPQEEDIELHAWAGIHWGIPL